MNKDSEDSNYLPPSEDDVSLGDEDFIVRGTSRIRALQAPANSHGKKPKKEATVASS